MPITNCWLSNGRACVVAALLVLVESQAQAQAPVQKPGERAFVAEAAANAPAAPPRRSFATPEEAVRALVVAVAAPTLEALTEILGRSALESVPPEERQSTEIRRATGRRLAG